MRAICILRRQMTPRPVQHGGGVELAVLIDPNVSVSLESRLRRSLLRAETRAVHYSTHQVFDQLLADQAILMAAPAPLDGATV